MHFSCSAPALALRLRSFGALVRNFLSHSLSIFLALRLLRSFCACARSFSLSMMPCTWLRSHVTSRSLENFYVSFCSLSHLLFCLALVLLRARSLCACSRSVRSLEVFLFLSRLALLLVAPACLLHAHSKAIVSHSLCLALALRLHPLCALAQDYSLTRYICPCARSRSSVCCTFA